MVVPSLTSIDNSNTPAAQPWLSEWARFGNMSKLTVKAHLYTSAGWAHAMLPDWHATQPKVKALKPDDCNARVVVNLRLELINEINTRLTANPPNVEDDTISTLIPFIHEEVCFKLMIRTQCSLWLIVDEEQPKLEVYACQRAKGHARNEEGWHTGAWNERRIGKIHHLVSVSKSICCILSRPN